MTEFATVDPRTGKQNATFETLNAEELEIRLAKSSEAFRSWRALAAADRSHVVARIGELHRANAQELAESMAREMGKPVSQGLAEVNLAASVYEYYADKGPQWLQDEEVEITIGSRALVRTEPIGPVFGIMPWNFPLYQVARFVAPNLMLGNSILLKHARACAGTSILIEQVIQASGIVASTFENLIVDSSAVEGLIADPRVRGVSFTGSEQAGRSVAAAAGRHLKKCILELGGSDPFIVMPDADLEQVFASAERGRFWNAGQVCNGAKRMIVHEEIWDEFLTGLVERAERWTAGDPLKDETLLGPMASASGRAEVAEQVADAVSKGAVLHTGGEIPVGEGFYFPMTVLSEVTPDMRAYREEIFGPVAVVYKVSSWDEAVALANDSDFGLGSSVFTGNLDLAVQTAERLEVGMVGVNTTIRSQPSLPFGGTKTSGLGRELGRLGFDEMSNKKVLQFA